MNLLEFERTIEKKILDRGFDYYENDQITEVEYIGQYEYSFEISGTEYYGVYVLLNEDLDIIEHDCECPYDWGPICKHKVAAFHYLRDLEPFDIESEAPTKFNRLEEQLNQTDKEYLIKTVVELCKRNKNIRKDFFSEFKIK